MSALLAAAGPRLEQLVSRLLGLGSLALLASIVESGVARSRREEGEFGPEAEYGAEDEVGEGPGLPSPAAAQAPVSAASEPPQGGCTESTQQPAACAVGADVTDEAVLEALGVLDSLTACDAGCAAVAADDALGRQLVALLAASHSRDVQLASLCTLASLGSAGRWLLADAKGTQRLLTMIGGDEVGATAEGGGGEGGAAGAQWALCSSLLHAASRLDAAQMATYEDVLVSLCEMRHVLTQYVPASAELRAQHRDCMARLRAVLAGALAVFEHHALYAVSLRHLDEFLAAIQP